MYEQKKRCLVIIMPFSVGAVWGRRHMVRSTQRNPLFGRAMSTLKHHFCLCNIEIKHLIVHLTGFSFKLVVVVEMLQWSYLLVLQTRSEWFGHVHPTVLMGEVRTLFCNRSLSSAKCWNPVHWFSEICPCALRAKLSIRSKKVGAP